MLKFVRAEYLQFSTALLATATVQKSGLGQCLFHSVQQHVAWEILTLVYVLSVFFNELKYRTGGVMPQYTTLTEFWGT